MIWNVAIFVHEYSNSGRNAVSVSIYVQGSYLKHLGYNINKLIYLLILLKEFQQM